MKHNRTITVWTFRLPTVNFTVTVNTHSRSITSLLYYSYLWESKLLSSSCSMLSSDWLYPKNWNSFHNSFSEICIVSFFRFRMKCWNSDTNKVCYQWQLCSLSYHLVSDILYQCKLPAHSNALNVHASLWATLLHSSIKGQKQWSVQNNTTWVQSACKGRAWTAESTVLSDAHLVYVSIPLVITHPVQTEL